MVETITGESQYKDELTIVEKQFCLQLMDIGAIKFGDFRLKLHDNNPEAPLSPIYINLRVLRRFPEVKEIAVTVYSELIKPLQYDLLADIPTSVTPLVSSLSDRLQVGQITPIINKKSHGIEMTIDGMLEEDVGKTAILIDDLITNASSKFEALDILKSQGIKVCDIVVLIDREQDGRYKLEKAGYNLYNAFTLKQMLDFYLQIGRLTNKEYVDTQSKIQVLDQFLKTKMKV